MKKILTVMSTLIFSTLLCSCATLTNSTEGDYYTNLEKIKMVNTTSTLKANSLKLKSEQFLNNEANTNDISPSLIDFKVISVSRALTYVTEASKYIESEVPVYQKKNKGDTVTDSEGNVVYQKDENGEYLLDDSGNKIPEVYEEDTFVKSDTIIVTKPVYDVVVDKYSSIEVEIQVLPTSESGLTSTALYRNAFEYGLLTPKNYILGLEDGTLVSPFNVSKGSDIRTFILEFYTMNSTSSYDEFFKNDTWGEELESEDVNEIYSIDYENTFTNYETSFKGFVDYQYDYIDEARNNLVAKAVQDYNLISSIPFKDE